MKTKGYRGGFEGTLTKTLRSVKEESMAKKEEVNKEDTKSENVIYNPDTVLAYEHKPETKKK